MTATRSGEPIFTTTSAEDFTTTPLKDDTSRTWVVGWPSPSTVLANANAGSASKATAIEMSVRMPPPTLFIRPYFGPSPRP